MSDSLEKKNSDSSLAVKKNSDLSLVDKKNSGSSLVDVETKNSSASLSTAGLSSKVKGPVDFGAATSGKLKVSRKMEEAAEAHHVHHTLDDELASVSRGSHEKSFAEEEPWIAGFIDLIYVATIMNISHFLTKCGAYFNVWLLAAAYFLLMFLSRYHIDVYAICFLANDVLHRMIFLLYCLGVFIMALNIAIIGNSAEGHRLLAESETYGSPTLDETDIWFVGDCSFESDYSYGFAAGFVFTRLSVMALYLISIYFSHKPENQREYAIKMLPCCLSLVIMFFTFGDWSPVAIFPVCALVEWLASTVPEMLTKVRFQPEAEALQERLGLYFMLVLGESMIGLLTVQPNIDQADKTYTVLVFSFLLVFSIGMQFFDTVHRSTELDHEEREEEEKHIHENLMERIDEQINLVLSKEQIADEELRKERRHELKHSAEFKSQFEAHYQEEMEAMETRLANSPYLHALESENRFIRQCFIWFHSTICFFMLVATNGFVNLYYDANGNTEEDHDKYGDRFKLSIGLFTTVLLMVTMRGFHRRAGYLTYLQKDYKRILFKVVIAVVHLVIFTFPIDSHFCLVIHSGVAGFSNFIEVIWHFVNVYFCGESEAQYEQEEVGEQHNKHVHVIHSSGSGRVKMVDAHEVQHVELTEKDSDRV